MYPTIKNFNHFLENSEKIKKEYGGVYSPKFGLKYIEGWRNYIYTRTNISKRKRELMWEYMNYDLNKKELINIVFAIDKNKELYNYLEK